MNKYLNFIAVNSRTIVSVVVSLLSVGIICRALSVAVYAEIVVMLTIVAALGLLGNAVVDACVKRVMALSNSQDWREVSVYLSSALAAISLLAFLVFVAIWMVYFIFGTVINKHSFLLASVFLLGGVVTLYSGVLRVGSFYVERFALQSIFHVISRLLYLGALIVLLGFTDFRIWSVAIASLLSALMLVFMMRYDLHRYMPDVRLKVTLINYEVISALVKNIGYMTLVYIGIYLSTSGVLLASKALGVEDSIVVGMALAISVGGIVNQLLSSFAYLAVPKIYKYVSVNDDESALRVVSITSFTVVSVLSFGLMMIYYDGINAISLWLGQSLEPDLIVFILAGAAVFGLNVIGIQWSHYCAAKNLLSRYAQLTVIEGVLAVGLAIVCLMGLNRSGYMAAMLVPVILFVIKICIVKNKIANVELTRSYVGVLQAGSVGAVLLIMILINAVLIDVNLAFRISVMAGLALVGTFYNLKFLR